MRPLLRCLPVILSFFLLQPTFAQVENIKPEKTTVSFLGGVIFAPRLHYFGRTDSLKSNALIPTLRVQLDSAHVYISGSGVFINNKVQSMNYAGTILEAGYQFGKSTGFAGNVFVNKFFYNTRQLPQSALKAQAGINIGYLNPYINIASSASAAFSDKTDFFASLGVNHNFKWIKDKSVFLITPSFTANAGSQNFFQPKYSGVPVPLPNATIEESHRFTLLSYEANLALIFARKHFIFLVTPSYVIPQHVVTVTGYPQLSETASNIFYANFTLLFSLKK